MHDLIPEERALTELEKLKLTQLRPAKRVHLEPLKPVEIDDTEDIDWNYHSHNVSWGLLVVLVPLTIAIILVCVYLVKQRKMFPGIMLAGPSRRDPQHLLAKCDDRERNDELTIHHGDHPFAYFRKINLKDEERDIQPMEVEQASKEENLTLAAN